MTMYLNVLKFVSFLFVVPGLLMAQENKLNIYGGEVKTIAMGNENVHVNNNYYPEEEFRAYFKDFEMLIKKIPDQVNLELIQEVELIAESKVLLLDSLLFYQDKMSDLNKKIVTLKAENNNQARLLKESQAYLDLTENVIKGTKRLVSDGYKIIETGLVGSQRYAFNKNAILADPTRLIVFRYKNGVAKVKKSNKYGLVDLEGNFVADLKYDTVQYFSEGLALVKNNGKYGFINGSGEETIGIQFEGAKEFRNGVAAVKKGYYWYFIDLNGNNTFISSEENKYRFYGDAVIKLGDLDHNGIAIACTHNGHLTHPDGQRYYPDNKRKCGLLKKNGEYQVALSNDYSDIKPVGGNLYPVKNRRGKWGFIDKDGNQKILFKYSNVTVFQNDRSIVTLEINGNELSGVINTNEMIIIPLAFKKVEYTNGNFAIDSRGNGPTLKYKYLVSPNGDLISGNKKKYEKEFKR